MTYDTLHALIIAAAEVTAASAVPLNDKEIWVNDAYPPYVQKHWADVAAVAHTRAVLAACRAIREGFEVAMEKAGRSIERSPPPDGWTEAPPRGEDIALFKDVVASDPVRDAAKEAAIMTIEMALLSVQERVRETADAASMWLGLQPVAVNHTPHDSSVKVIQDERFFVIPDNLEEDFKEGLEQRIIAHLDDGYTNHDLQAAADLRGVQEGYKGAGDQLSASAAGDLLEIHAELVETHLPKLKEAIKQQDRTSGWER